MAKIDLRVNVERSQLDKLTKDVNSLSNKTIQLQIGGSQANTIEKKATAVRNLNTELGKLKESSGGASVKITGTANAMKLAKTATAETSAEMKNFWREIDTGAKQTVVFNGTMGETVRRMAIWRTIGFGLKAFTSSMKEALSTIKDVDAELVTVRKVTGFSDEKMASIERGAYATASKYGESAQDYLASVASFARAGYRDQAEALAELSLKTQIVGDTTANTANQFLLAVDKAYQYQGSIEKLTKVLDGANELDNKYATSIEKIAEGMGIVAPVAAQMHVTIDELAAGIGTITAVTQRSGAESARALRALFLNIAGDTKTEIEEGVTWTTGEIEGLRDIIKKYSKDAYEAAQATGDVIDPMKAMAGLAQSMKEGVLSEQELVQMVSDIGGKLRSSQLLAIIQNWDMYEAMLEDFKNAAGSADKEIDNAMDSWERKVSVLKNSWAEFVAKTIDSGVIKGALDLLNELISGIGDLGTAIALVGTGISLWKLGDLLTMISKVKMLIGEFGGGLLNIVKYIRLYTTTQRAAKKVGIEYSDELLKQVVQHKANAAATATETAATSTSAAATNASAAASEADTTAKGAEATAINAATASMNLYHLAAVGAVAVLSILIFAINKHKQAQEEAAQAHEEAIRKAAQSAETAREQIDGLKKLRQEYLDIVDSETTETEKAKELDRWKQTLIETYGLEKSALEGVNAERKTGLGLIDEEIKKQRDQSIADLSAAYDEAKQQMERGSYFWLPQDLWYAYRDDLFSIPDGGVPKTDDDIVGWIGTDTYDAYEKIANKIAELRKRNNNLTEQEKELLSLLEKEYEDLGARIEKYGGIYTEYNRLMAEAKLEEMGLSNATIESGKAYAEAVIEILRSNEALGIKKEMLSQLAALYPQFSKAVSDAASATGALADAELSVEQKAAGAVAALNELRGANKGAEEAARGNIAPLFDESNQSTDAAKAAMLADSSLADYTISQLEAERAA
jgi:TP901 family phage tail tape measure protein